MITTELIESTWKAMQQYEREYFGCKNGADYPAIASSLGASERFRHLGAMTAVMAMLIMRPEKFQSEADAKNFMDQLGPMHTTLAEMFYLGLLVGRRIGDVEKLEHDLNQRENP